MVKWFATLSFSHCHDLVYNQIKKNLKFWADPPKCENSTLTDWKLYYKASSAQGVKMVSFL